MSSPLSHLCGICDEFWDVPGASAATADFDAYAAAVQAHNADIISLNQQVAGICEEPMTGIEPALSAWEAEVLPLNYIGVRHPMDAALTIVAREPPRGRAVRAPNPRRGTRRRHPGNGPVR